MPIFVENAANHVHHALWAHTLQLDTLGDVADGEHVAFNIFGISWHFERLKIMIQSFFQNLI
jgi:hypothetical protein